MASPATSAKDTTTTTRRFKPRVVIAVHGIRTHAKWYHRIAETLGDEGIRFRLFDFGFFRVHRFVRKSQRERMVDKFCEFYHQVVRDRALLADSEHPSKRPSVVAHSFGTYLVGYCLKTHRHVKFNQVILCGSILPRNFDWGELVGRGQVQRVRNEYSQNDRWTRMVGFFVPHTGDSGNLPFENPHPQVEQDHFEYYLHHKYFNWGHIRSDWLPFLMREPAPLVRTPLGLRAVQGRELQLPNEYKTYIEQKILNVDTPCFGHLPGFWRETPTAEKSLSWAGAEPDIYTFLVNPEGQVQGYIDALPVTDWFFSGVKSGEQGERLLHADHITGYRANEDVKVYVTAFAVAPETRYKGRGFQNEAFDGLANAFLSKLIHHAKERRTRVTEVVAEAWTPEGERVCRMFGMEEVAKQRDPATGIERPVYWVSLKEHKLEKAQKTFGKLRELLSIYRGMR